MSISVAQSPFRDLKPRNYLITIYSILIPVTEVRELGVLLDSQWIFDKHITKITNKAYQMLGFVFDKEQIKKITLTVLYNSYVFYFFKSPYNLNVTF